MELNSCLEVIICVIIGFLLRDFWTTLLWVYGGIIQHGHRNENRRIPVEHEEDQGKVYNKNQLMKAIKKAAYCIIIVDRLKDCFKCTSDCSGFKLSASAITNYINRSLIPKLRELLSEFIDKKWPSVPQERRQSVYSNHFLCKHE